MWLIHWRFLFCRHQFVGALKVQQSPLRFLRSGKQTVFSHQLNKDTIINFAHTKQPQYSDNKSD